MTVLHQDIGNTSCIRTSLTVRLFSVAVRGVCRSGRIGPPQSRAYSRRATSLLFHEQTCSASDGKAPCLQRFPLRLTG